MLPDRPRILLPSHIIIMTTTPDRAAIEAKVELQILYMDEHVRVWVPVCV